MPGSYSILHSAAKPKTAASVLLLECIARQIHNKQRYEPDRWHRSLSHPHEFVYLATCFRVHHYYICPNLSFVGNGFSSTIWPNMRKTNTFYWSFAARVMWSCAWTPKSTPRDSSWHSRHWHETNILQIAHRSQQMNESHSACEVILLTS